MRNRTLPIAALAAALLAAVTLSLAAQPVSHVTASYRADPGCWELVKNWSFEALTDWVISVTAFPAAYSTAAAHSGVQSMQLGIPPGYSDRYAWSSVYQDVTIPFGTDSATLSFWYRPYTLDTSGRDVQGMILYDQYWNRLQTVLEVLSNSGTWTYKTLNVSAYAGQTVRVYFYVSNNQYYPSSGRTWMYVDDVSLECCSEVTPEPSVTPTVQLGFNPTVKSVYPFSGPFQMTVVITNVADLGAFEFDLTYDPDVVLVEDVELASFLERTGRIASTTHDDTLKLDGRYRFGAYTMPPAGDPGRAGPTGSGVLVTTFLSPVDDGETRLDFDKVRLFDTDGDAIPIADLHIIDGYVIVEQCVGDLNHDGVVDIVDVAMVANSWGCKSGDACYDDDCDFNDNGVIDVGDIMAVVVRWGECEVAQAASVLPQGVEPSDVEMSVVKIEPRKISVNVGESFTISVAIQDVTDLGHFQFDLRYDPAFVQVTGDPTLGRFLEDAGRDFQLWLPPDQEAGRLEVVGFSTGYAEGPEGDGTLVDIVLTAKWMGEGNLWLEGVRWMDTQQGAGLTAHNPATLAGQVTIGGGSYVYLPLALKE